MTYLSEYEFPGDDVPVIKGSALKALQWSPPSRTIRRRACSRSTARCSTGRTSCWRAACSRARADERTRRAAADARPAVRGSAQFGPDDRGVPRGAGEPLLRLRHRRAQPAELRADRHSLAVDGHRRADAPAGLQYFLGRPVASLPDVVGRRGLPRGKLQDFLARIRRQIERLENAIHPRLDWWVSGLPRRCCSSPGCC